MKFTVKNTGRINKAIQDTGMYSRREADSLIERRKVHVNDTFGYLGMQVREGDSIEIRSGTAQIEKKLDYALYYKPIGEVTSTKEAELLKGLHPVGRLDKESEGLLVYTNDPTLTEALMNPENKIEKEYRVKTREKSSPRVPRIMMSGMYTQEEKYAPAKMVKVDDGGHHLTVVLVEGKKHEIRRMLNGLNMTIISLKRIRIHNLKIGTMKPGQIKKIERPTI